MTDLVCRPLIVKQERYFLILYMLEMERERRAVFPEAKLAGDKDEIKKKAKNQLHKKRALNLPPSVT